MSPCVSNNNPIMEELEMFWSLRHWETKRECALVMPTCWINFWIWILKWMEAFLMQIWVGVLGWKIKTCHHMTFQKMFCNILLKRIDRAWTSAQKKIYRCTMYIKQLQTMAMIVFFLCQSVCNCFAKEKEISEIKHILLQTVFMLLLFLKCKLMYYKTMYYDYVLRTIYLHN